MSKHSKNIKLQAILFWTALITSWLTFLFFFTIPFGILFWIGVLIYLFVKRTKLKWYLILLSAWTLIPLFSFVSATKDYFQGKATLETVGMPDAEFWNLDPSLRVWHSTSGCIVVGYELFTQTPNNMAIRFWTNLLGTQSNVYKGYYPTKDEVSSALAKSTLHVKFSGNQETINFNYNGEAFKIITNGQIDFDFIDKTESAKVLVLRNECIAFQPVSDTARLETILADKSTGKIFARYFNYQTR